jgi:hypothetical protein
MADLPNVFESNAAKLKDLHEAIHTALARRSESPARRAVWEDACRRFHAEYASLAFPGGLARAFSQLEAGDPTAIAMAVRFLEADLYFFRSGYHKEDFIKHLCKNPLSEDQKKRLREVILARIRGRDPRNFAPTAVLRASSRSLRFRSGCRDGRPLEGNRSSTRTKGARIFKVDACQELEARACWWLNV